MGEAGNPPLFSFVTTCRVVEAKHVRIIQAATLPLGFPFEAALDDIFFAASNTRAFASDDDREVFRERWLGRYLSRDRAWVYLAFNGDRIVGYLVGSLDDAARTERFADIPYFAGFAALTARYPAHLHINMAVDARGCGGGSKLIERFAADAAQAGAPGVHVVTGRGQRNIGFYQRNGFSIEGSQGSGSREVVFLGRALHRQVKSAAP